MNTNTELQPLLHYLMGLDSQQIGVATQQQEHFCRLVASGNTYAAAYKVAYNIDPEREASGEYLRISRAPHVVARIMQLRADAVRGVSVDRTMLVESMIWALNTARERGSTDQVRKITMDIGKLFGLVIEKSEAEVLNKFQVMKDVTLDGDALSFNIGDGKTIAVKGQPIDVTPQPAAPEPESPIAAGNSSPLDALRNAKSVPSSSVHVDTDALPIEAILESGAKLQRDDGRTSPMYRKNHVTLGDGTSKSAMDRAKLKGEAIGRRVVDSSLDVENIEE